MVKMTYHQWEKLTAESQDRLIALGKLPDVPPADLEDGLRSAQMIIKDGEGCWEIQFDSESQPQIFPEHTKKDLWGVLVTCKFNPYIGKYTLPDEYELAGYYGGQWMAWMEEHHKNKVRKMKSAGTYLAVAQSVNRDALNYRKLLDNQYEELHPRPHEICGESELQAWKFTRNFYTDGLVMRERVLIPHKTA